MSKRWLKEKKKDYYYKKAKSEAYRSRASFKLKQLNKRFRLMKEKDAVLDLGAAPGGWMQVAGEIVGEEGIVMGVDIVEIEPFEEKNLLSIKGDITKKETIENVKARCRSFDVVICDASPDISGVWDVDHFNSVELARHALRISKEVLKEGGNFLVKVFQGSMVNEFVGEVRREFEFTKVSKPKASRSRSAEIYVVGKGLLKTPVKYGDVVEVEITKKGQKGDGVAFVEGFKVVVRGGMAKETAKVRIKKVSKELAWGVEV
ncbi:MAG: SAM-dependent methyltransferase [Candidatus Hydrothermarchaeales archaeon]